ncbi:hypothetical protein FALBO_1382 [Fusarium albosuccineum]|uniref:Uncharacterized protein n=1 Tax=Fusarium albosuccineum TaxID=1237068 RepID=A0A8H4LND5_9HYPO|nr:hypothetical protein FALBO_1382 [Fusarium albosuccineum]
MPSSTATEKPLAPKTGCGECRRVLESGPKFRARGSSFLLCSHCAVNKSLEGSYIAEQFLDDRCPICWEEKPTVLFTCEADILSGHSFCKTCVLQIRPRGELNNGGGDEFVGDDLFDDESVGDEFSVDESDSDDDDGDMRITEVAGALLLPTLPEGKQLRCPICRGQIVDATMESVIPESALVTDPAPRGSDFAVPKDTLVINLSGDSDMEASGCSRKRKRGKEPSIGEERERLRGVSTTQGSHRNGVAEGHRGHT